MLATTLKENDVIVPQLVARHTLPAAVWKCWCGSAGGGRHLDWPESFQFEESFSQENSPKVLPFSGKFTDPCYILTLLGKLFLRGKFVGRKWTAECSGGKFH